MKVLHQQEVTLQDSPKVVHQVRPQKLIRNAKVSRLPNIEIINYHKICEYYAILLFSEVESDASIIVAPLSISGLTFLVGIATLIAGVVMLVRAKTVLHHSSQAPPPGTDHYEMVDEEAKRARLGAGGYEEVDKQDTQTDGHTKHYQELDLEKMERREYASIKV